MMCPGRRTPDPDAVFRRVNEMVAPSYLVGTSAREVLMGRVPSGYTFATPWDPDAIETAVRAQGKRVYTADRRFGTIGFKWEGVHVEVTTFRAATYAEGRKSPHVEFLRSIEDDLGYRDFTMNAMAIGPEGVIDPFGGRADIEAGVIRAVGDARKRFKEDPVRMLRAARFVAQYGLELDEATEAAAMRFSHRILQTARERWLIELDKLLVGPYVRSGLEFLARTRLLNYLVPEVAIQVGYDQNSPWHELTLWEHTLGVVEDVPAEAELRWAALLHDVGKPFMRQEKPGRSTYVRHDLLGADLVERIALWLEWPRERTEQVRDLVHDHLAEGNPLKAADDANKRLPHE